MQSLLADAKATEETLRRREAILETVAVAAHQFLRTPDWTRNIQEVLARLGSATGVSRAYALENHRGADGTLLMRQRYEWVAPGMSPRADNPELRDLPWLAAGLGRLMEELGRGGTVHGHVREFPETERAFLASQQIRSIAAVPVFVEGEWWGFIGFDECTRERDWSAAELDALSVAAGTLGAAIERQRASEQRQRTTMLLATLLGNLRAGVLVESDARLVLRANAHFCELFGIASAPEALAGLDCRQCAQQSKVLFAEPERFIERIEDIVSRRTEVLNEELVLADGRVFERDYVPMTMDHDYLGHLWSYREITERKRAAEALRRSEEEYRGLFDESVAAIYAFDSNKNLVNANQAGLDLLGYSREELLKLSIADVDADPVVVLPAHERLLSGARLVNYEHRLRRKDGTVVTVLNNSRPLADVHGDVVGMLSTLIDITGRKRAEEGLQASEARYRALFEHAPEGLVMGDAGARCLDANASTCRMLGYTRDELIGLHASEIIVESVRSNVEPALTAIKAGSDYERDWQLRRKDGSIFSADIGVTTMPDGNLLGTIRDLTERNRAEAERMKLEAQLRQAQKMEAIGQLAGGVAHDFNNVLAAILGNTELALQDTPPGHPAVECLKEIKRAGYRAKSVVQQILAFSRQQPRERHVIPLDPLIEENARLLRATIPAGIEIVTSIGAGVPPVLADSTQIHQLIVNLCTNAWHAHEGRPGRIDIKLESVTLDSVAAARIAGLQSGRFACLSVSDTGKGIDAAALERIFDPFFTTKGPHEGTGLGLSVVHGIVQAHDAVVTVDSQPGRGTTFRVYFPAAVAAVDPQTSSALAPRRGEGQRILYLDDEEPLVSVATRMLERLGYRVAGFTHAAQAVAAFRDNPAAFDIVITDLNMPGTSGLRVAEDLLSIRPEVPVVLCSGHVTEELRQRARAAGIRDVLYKPNTVEELGEAISRLAIEPRRVSG
ncbi:MAG: PAS domain S-box protein [Deltaproteobacteria bacterium]|nr:PAS domain S-box protein [Deltaproteobacteria bacterium]